MKDLTDKKLVEQLKAGENEAFGRLYHLYFPAIAAYTKRNNGNDADAEDIFQEAVLVFLQKLRQPEFILTSSLKTYLFAISKNIWLKRLRDNKMIPAEIIEPWQLGIGFPFDEPEKSREEKLSDWLNRITENCQKILKAIFFYSEPMENVMKKMGWKNKHTAANQQYKCIQQVKKQRALEEGT